MEATNIVIVGAGPAGLVLGLSLAQQGIKSIILEKEEAVTDDPRGVYLASDAVRILYAIGLGKYMSNIGHELHQVQFHQGSFSQPPFHAINLLHDNLQQAVSNGVLQIQPELEKALRKEVEASKYCELRLGCEVLKIEEAEDAIRLAYRTPASETKVLQAAWLVGADGKKGVVRKGFLEKMADIRQIDSAYKYEGTWVASNLLINDPTPKTHPHLPFWQLGMSPADVYDLYWPKGWHFCSPPGKPTAAGRFGPFEARLWRHEFRQETDVNDKMDAEALLWEHITPMITRTADKDGNPFPDGAVTFPKDCIRILRCRPFSFCHKTVNRWFWRRTLLIGDAAHVFPPFGGQGIASGVRDAHQLAWRLALLDRNPELAGVVSDRLFDAWSKERKASVADAAALTRINGMLCNNDGMVAWTLLLLRPFVQFLEACGYTYDPQVITERSAFSTVKGAFCLPNHGGGLRMPQIYMDTLFEKRILSDQLLLASGSVFKLLVLTGEANTDWNKVSKVKAEVLASGVADSVLSTSSIGLVSPLPAYPDRLGHFSENHTEKAAPTPARTLPYGAFKAGYRMDAIQHRLGTSARFVIVRPDFHIFATAKSMKELRSCLVQLREMCRDG